MHLHYRVHITHDVTHQCLLQLWYVHVQCLVDLQNVQQWSALDAVEKLTAGSTDPIPLEIPIKEHPGRDDPFVVGVAVEAVVVSVKLAKLGLAKDWEEERGEETAE